MSFDPRARNARWVNLKTTRLQGDIRTSFISKGAFSVSIDLSIVISLLKLAAPVHYVARYNIIILDYVHTRNLRRSSPNESRHLSLLFVFSCYVMSYEYTDQAFSFCFTVHVAIFLLRVAVFIFLCIHITYTLNRMPISTQEV